MTTNEKIAKWLGVKKHKWISSEGESYSYINENIDKESSELRIVEYLDFLHDRNQQKWIIDELKKRGWIIKIHITDKRTWVSIYKLEGMGEKIVEYGGSEPDDGEALIQAVEQLIDKENEIK
jgi:Uri superfamily endonuclease